VSAGVEILPFRTDERVRQLGRELIEDGFGRGVSLFMPERPVWSALTVEELHRCYNQRPDEGSDPFLVKLRRQVNHAPAAARDDVILLVAELLTLQALPLRNINADTKRAKIHSVVGWMRPPVPVPDRVMGAFEQFTWHGGIGGLVMQWKWLADAVEFLRYWWQLSPDHREQALSDPWTWQDVIYDHKGVDSLREELLYLGFPTHFLPIVNVSHKKLIRKAFFREVADPSGDLNRELFQITVAIQQQAGRPVDLYRPPYVGQWKKAPPGERAWLVRPEHANPDLLRSWQREGFVSVTAQHLTDIGMGAPPPDVRAAVDAGYPHLDFAQRISLANEYHAFLSQMDDGNPIATVVDDLLYLGAITGGPEYEPDAEGTHLRRPVTWTPTPPIPVDEVPAQLASALEQPGTVVDLTGVKDLLAGLVDSTTPTSDDAEEPPGRLADEGEHDPATTALPDATHDLARRTYIRRDWLQDLIDLLQERQQIILYGPPGTGKTFVAQAVARHVAARDAIRLVQFHPSYAYEDFFEGFRPVEGADSGTVSLVKVPGPLREIADEARANPGQPYVLIIDEINRANLAKVFGELYYLLEYRNGTVRLQYTPGKPFNLPPNVLIIGTMNTADRSIALVDAAIRRRFAFVELHPDEEPVRDVLAGWLTDHAAPGDQRAELLQALNDAIGNEDHDFKIGPSYLMKPHLNQPGRLERVWRHDLLPLLEEHYYGRYTRAQIRQRFGLDAIRTRIANAGDGYATSAPTP
jgi:5-methylcytosine-specific restriction protein B